MQPAIAEGGLPAELADALDDDSLDAELRAETDEALSPTGKRPLEVALDAMLDRIGMGGIFTLSC